MGTKNVQSKEQKAMYNLMEPWMNRLFTGDTSSLYDIGQAPSYSGYDIGQAPSYIGYNVGNAPGYSGYDVGSSPAYKGYEIPDAKSMMPTGNWWDTLDSDIKAGIMQPYEQGSKQLGEQLLSYGQGSQIGGASGSMAAGLGQYWADASPQMAKEGWGMISPALQAQWQAQLGLNQTKAGYDYQTGQNQWQAELEQGKTAADYGFQGDMAQWQAELAQGQTTASNNYNTAMTQWNALMNQNQTIADKNYESDLLEWQANLNQQQLPYNAAMNMIGGTYATPVVSQPWYSSLLGGAGNAGASYGLSKLFG